jgi:hypothetical protein
MEAFKSLAWAFMVLWVDENMETHAQELRDTG